MRRVERLRVIAATLLLGVFLVYMTPRVATVVPYEGYTAILDVHRFIAGIRQEFGPHVQLVTSTPPAMNGLNRFSEITFPPVGGVPSYIFPYLSALNGADFQVVDRAAFCRSLEQQEGAAFLVPAVAEGLALPFVWRGRLFAALDNGYALVVPVRGFFALEALLKRRIAGVNIYTSVFDLSHVLGPDVVVIEEYPGVLLLISKTSSISLTMPLTGWPNGAARIAFHSPLGQERSEALRVLVDGPGARREVNDVGWVKVVVDFGRVSETRIDVSESSFSSALGGYTLRITNPEISVPSLDEVENVSMCRSFIPR